MARRRKTGRVIEGFWKCQYCGNERILARYRECPQCGHPKDKSTNFDMDSNSKFVSKEEAKKISRKPDWLCSFCESLNSDEVSSCESCGHTREESDKNYFKMKEEREEKEKQKEEEYKRQEEEVLKNAHDNDNSYYKEKSSIKNFFSNFSFNTEALITILISLLGVGLFVGLIFLFIPKEKELIVDNYSWEVNIQIQELKTFDESGWSLPSDARLSYTREEFYGTEEVVDHYETRTREVSHEEIVGYDTIEEVEYIDLGNGYFEEEIVEYDVPIYETVWETEEYEVPIYKTIEIYKTKYYYEIDRWTNTRTITTNGNDKNPIPGEYTLANKERANSPTYSYYIEATIVDEDEPQESIKYSIPKEDWIDIQIGNRIKANVNMLNMLEIIEILE